MSDSHENCHTESVTVLSNTADFCTKDERTANGLLQRAVETDRR